MKKIGLFFGSFNPIHIGHLILANHMVEFTDIHELWFIVSPQNPFKSRSNLLEQHHRLEMVNLAIENYPRMKASDIEFSMPKPSYTIDTLTFLQEKFPNIAFTLIMGEDILKTLHKWKNYEKLVNDYEIIVYPRLFSGREPTGEYHLKSLHIHLVDAPIIELSATKIRQMIAEGRNVRPLLPTKVFEYIDGSNLYK